MGAIAVKQERQENLAGISSNSLEATNRHAKISSSLRPSGEIGRHSGLKIRRLPERGRTGSIPVSGTNSMYHLLSSSIKARSVLIS